MKRVLIAAAMLGLGAAAHAQAPTQPPTQAPERPCMADAARLCAGIEPGGGAQLTCLKAHTDELSPACKKKVLEKKVQQKEQEELQRQQGAMPQP
jgi:hypothetical protein